VPEHAQPRLGGHAIVKHVSRSRSEADGVSERTFTRSEVEILPPADCKELPLEL
jgi:hypothetical protein